MKILIYTHPFAPTVGGAETYVMLLAQGLAGLASGNSNEIVVATPTPAGDFDDSKLTFRVVRQPGLFTLIDLIAKADVIQLAGPCILPLLIAWVLGKPAVIEHHGYPPICPNGMLFYEPSQTVCPGYFCAHRYDKCLGCNAVTVGWLKSLKLLVLTFPRRWLCERVAANTPISEHVQGRLKLPRSQVIYYGIPEARDDAQAQPVERSRAGPLYFAYAGRLVTLKGLPLILEAAKRLQIAGYDFRVKFVGDGPERGDLESRVEELGLRKYVEFTGFLTGPAFQAAMQGVAAVLMPSICEETAGLSAIEQMMRGKLVIASNIGGLGEVVDGGGLRFTPGSGEALADCMKTVLDQPEIVERNGQAARRRALELFTQPRMVREHFELYCRLTTPTDREKKAERLA